MIRWLLILLLLCPALVRANEPAQIPACISLDGTWLLATDPKNAGEQARWFREPRSEARATRVPWIIQDAFPGYHGVAWYWRSFLAPTNPNPDGRTLMRFWAVDYHARLWLNGQPVGEHEGGESPFTLDVTGALLPGVTNLLAVRILNPTHEPIDGIVLNQTPHRNKALPYASGSAWNQGGIVDSVELLLRPAARVEDLFVRADPRSGRVLMQTTVVNSAPHPLPVRLTWTLAPAAGGETSHRLSQETELPVGRLVLTNEIVVLQPRLWELNDPYLYRVTALVRSESPAGLDEQSARCGFRDFRFTDGAFRLNGRRIYLRCSHTGNSTPVGLELPHDPDLLRRDLVNAKMMRFNAIRFIAGVAKRQQLDLCDELGLMVYEESYAAWSLADSPHVARRYDESVLGMVRRDRNHPSVVIWGLLNETPDGPVFRHAAGSLGRLRELDDSRLVMLNSGRWDKLDHDLAGLQVWRNVERTDPCVTWNGTDHPLQGFGIKWAPGQLALHPGKNGEFAVVRWIASREGNVTVTAEFRSIAERATTDVHVLHNGRSLFSSLVHLGGAGPSARFESQLAVHRGDTLDCAVGFGNGDYGADTTALAMKIVTGWGTVEDAAEQFDLRQNPGGRWSYGQLPPSAGPQSLAFVPFPQGSIQSSIGSLSNPGSTAWENVLSDQHTYPRVPHLEKVIRLLRSLDGKNLPVFLSEYGIGSPMDLIRIGRHYEQLGKTEVEDARLYAQWRDDYLADYARYGMADMFPRPEDFFAAGIARMAGQRALGLNAIRANPRIVGYSLTGTVDQGMTGEGLWTTFRELKPGTTDALFDGWAPLRWCLFAEPANAVRGAPLRIEAVLANEDALQAGRYPARFLIAGPDGRRVWEKRLEVTVADPGSRPEPPMVTLVLDEEVSIDGPPGEYRFLADFERGAAASGGTASFHLHDPADLPQVECRVALWGHDPELHRWLESRDIATTPSGASPSSQREVILAAGGLASLEEAEQAAAWGDLARRMARGSTVVFLTPQTLQRGDQPTGWLPLRQRGTLRNLPSWLYHKEEWCKRHPLFDGLPSGGLMDYLVYRETLPDAAFVDQEPAKETVAAGINASLPYSSGTFVTIHPFGAGRFLLSSLRIRENLDSSPVAERLLRNFLNYAARETQAPLESLTADFEASLAEWGYR